MIIQQISAKNIFRYARLDVQNIPQQGLIAVSGSNESGKTTIFEAIAFALFGRTFTLQGDELIKLIKWGESQCFVHVEFLAKDNLNYSIMRTLDNNGHQGARLMRADSKEVIARGDKAVNALTAKLCGFHFEDFINSLYLVQEENNSYDLQKETIKSIAGITALEQVKQDCNNERKQAEHDLQESIAQQTEKQHALDVLEFNEQDLATLSMALSDEQNNLEQVNIRISSAQEQQNHLQNVYAKLYTQMDKMENLALDGKDSDWKTQVDKTQSLLSPLEEAYTPGIDTTIESTPVTGKLQSILTDFSNKLLALSDFKTKVIQFQDKLQQETQTLTTELNALQQKKQVLQTQQQKALHITLFFLFLATLSWGKWALLNIYPDSSLGITLHGWVSAIVPQYDTWSATLQTAIPMTIAILFTLLFILFAIRTGSLNRLYTDQQQQTFHIKEEIAQLKNKLSSLEDIDKQGTPVMLNIIDDISDEAMQYDLQQFKQTQGSPFVALTEWKSYLSKINQISSECSLQINSVIEQYDQDIADLEQEKIVIQEKIAESNEQITHENQRREQAFQLMDTLAQLNKTIIDLNEQIAVRKSAIDLLNGAIKDNTTAFNMDLRKFIHRTMPLLTNERYHYLQLSDSLDVAVFSTEKHDYVELKDVSTGTQKQIMLSLRLALAEALAETSNSEQQSIILDEPFAFFDQERIQRTLQAFPELSTRLTQIWVIAQEFIDDSSFALHIHCQHDSDLLTSQ